MGEYKVKSVEDIKKLSKDGLKKEFEKVVDATSEILAAKDKKTIWRDIYGPFAQDALNNQKYEEQGKLIRNKIKDYCVDVDELQLYTSKTNFNSSSFDLRFRGQSICKALIRNTKLGKTDIKLSVDKDTDKRNSIWFPQLCEVLKPGKGNELSIEDNDNIKKIFDILKGIENKEKDTKSPEHKDVFKEKDTKSPEHKLESLVLRNLGKIEAFKNIQPVNLGDFFIQWPTQLSGREHKPNWGKRKDKNPSQGHIDILARVNDNRLAVIELKGQSEDKKKDEPPEYVLIQALIYATCIAHLLAEETIGMSWYEIFYDENSSVPDNLEIFVMAMMPRNENTKTGEEDPIDKKIKGIEIKRTIGRKTITLIPCTCFLDVDDNFTKFKEEQMAPSLNIYRSHQNK